MCQVVPSRVVATASTPLAGSAKSPPTAMPCRGVRNARANTPADSPAGIVESVAVQVRPRSSERKTRAAPPPEPKYAVLPAVTRQSPLAAKPYSVGGLRHALVREHAPRAAGVLGGEDPELPVDRVAHHQPAPAAGVERHAVVERRGVVVDERRVPGLATVGGAVDPRRVALPDGQDHGGPRAARLDVAEQQALGAGGLTSCQVRPPSVVRNTRPGPPSVALPPVTHAVRRSTASRPRKPWSASTTVSFHDGFPPWWWPLVPWWPAPMAAVLPAYVALPRRGLARRTVDTRRVPRRRMPAPCRCRAVLSRVRCGPRQMT